MGSGVSFPSEEEALAAGVTQEQIDEHKKKLSAAAKTVNYLMGLWLPRFYQDHQQQQWHHPHAR